MTDETGQAVAEPVAPTTPASIVGPDLKFADNWREALPEELRDDKALSMIRDLPTLAKNYIYTKSMVGKDKVVVPAPNASESEWAEFYKAAGRPETAKDYGFKRPEQMPEELWNEDLSSKAQDLFHKIGLNKRQAAALMEFNNELSMQTYHANKVNSETQFAKIQDDLRKEWGQAYQSRVHMGNAAIEQGVEGNAEFKARLVEKFGNDPDFIRFASNLGAKFSEHGVIEAEKVATPAEVKGQIAEIMQSDAYTNRNNPGHKNAVMKVQQLFAAMK